jgi:uncharacterized surface protein with fasciclin (FAS1) repeats
VFAPTNEAFAALDVATIVADVGLLTEILLFHTVEDQVLYAADLSCELEANPLEMTNGEESFTLCVDGAPTFQVGDANVEGALPAIIAANVPACNGVIHVIDNVMLYNATA